MNWTPKKEDDFSDKLEGVFRATVVTAEEKLSKAGNLMFEIMLEVYDQKGRKRVCWDHLLPEGFKFRKFLYSAGEGELYESGQCEACDLEGLTVTARIVTGDVKPPYKPRPQVDEYLVPGDDAKEIALASATTILEAMGVKDDDVPF